MKGLCTLLVHHMYMGKCGKMCNYHCRSVLVTVPPRGNRFTPGGGRLTTRPKDQISKWDLDPILLLMGHKGPGAGTVTVRVVLLFLQVSLRQRKADDYIIILRI